MSELPKTVDSISLDAIIKIEVSGGFYSRLRQVLDWYCHQKPIDEFTKELASLKEEKPASEYAYHLETLLTLVRQIEHNAQEQGKIKTIETDKIIKSDEQKSK